MQRQSKSGFGFQSRLSAGFSLLELMVAMALSALAITLLFYSWNYISKHTLTAQRKTIFQADADRIAKTIAGQLRRSPEVITLNSDNATLLAPNGGDTITYAFVNGILTQNGSPISFIAPSCRVTQFSLEKENSFTKDPNGKTALVTVRIGIEDSFGNSSLIPLKVVVAYQEKGEDALSKKWAF